MNEGKKIYNYWRLKNDVLKQLKECYNWKLETIESWKLLTLKIIQNVIDLKRNQSLKIKTNKCKKI